MLLLLSGCATSSGPTMPVAADLADPKLIAGNNGKYMSPYTSDGVLALWVDKVISVQAGARAGEAIGTVIGSAATNNSGLGGLLGDAAGGSIGRQAALQAIGGEALLKEQSDLSFNTLEALSIFLYKNYSNSEYYNFAVDAAGSVYPALTPRKNLEFIVYAPKK